MILKPQYLINHLSLWSRNFLFLLNVNNFQKYSKFIILKELDNKTSFLFRVLSLVSYLKYFQIPALHKSYRKLFLIKYDINTYSQYNH